MRSDLEPCTTCGYRIDNIADRVCPECGSWNPPDRWPGRRAVMTRSGWWWRAGLLVALVGAVAKGVQFREFGWSAFSAILGSLIIYVIVAAAGFLLSILRRDDDDCQRAIWRSCEVWIHLVWAACPFALWLLRAHSERMLALFVLTFALMVIVWPSRWAHLNRRAGLEYRTIEVVAVIAAAMICFAAAGAWAFMSLAIETVGI